MAQVRADFLPTVEPAAAPPRDYQEIQATPADFGAQVGQATQRTGQAAVGAAGEGLEIALLRQRRYNEIATTDAFNNFQDKTLKVLYGDPSDPSKKGFYETTGVDAMSAYHPTLQSIDDTRKEILGGLRNDAQRLEFQQASRRFQTYMLESAGRHYDQQFKAWSINSNAATADVQGRAVAAQYNDDTLFAHSLMETRTAEVRAAQTTNGDNLSPDMLNSALAKADGKLITDRAMAWGATDPASALKWLQTGTMPNPVPGQPDVPVRTRLEPQTLLMLTNHFQGKADEKTGEAIGMGAVSNILHTGPATPAILDESAKQGVPVTTALTFAKIESDLGAAPDEPGNSHTGVYQMGPAEFAANGGKPEERGDIAAEVRVGVSSIPKSMAIATQAIGKPAEPWQGYIVHQQGAAGGPALLTAPVTTNVVDALAPAYGGNRATATMAVIRNGGRADMTTGDFLEMWRAKYADAQAAVSGMALPGNAMPAVTEATETHIMQDIMRQTEGNPRAATAGIEAAQRMLALQKKIQQDRAETSMNGFVQQLLKDPSQVTNEAIANSPLTAEQKWNMSRMRTQAILEGSDNKDTKTYGTGFYQLFQAVHAPQGDPSRITDPSALYSHVGPNGDLTVAGVDKLTAEIQGRRTPDGEAEATMKTAFLANARAQITGSNEGLHIRDPKGDEIYLKFLAQVLPQYETARKNGMSAADLLNPDSKDYLGKSIATFKRPASVWMKDMVDGSLGPEAAAGYDLDTQDGIVAAYKAGKMTRADAAQMLIDKGFASPPAGPAPRSPASAHLVPTD